MTNKFLVFALIGTLAISSCLGSVAFPAVPAAYSVPYASSYSAHVVNHAIAAPVASAPLVAAPAVAPYAAYSTYPIAAPFFHGK